MTQQVQRRLLGALTALVAACPGVAAGAPATGPAIGVTPTSAQVTATGVTAGARVAYGPTPDYGATAPAGDWPDEFLLTGLSPGATYHYRVETPDGSAGADRTLTTSAPGGPELLDRPTAAGITCTTGTWTPPSTVTTVTWWQGDTELLGGVPTSSGDYACRVTVASPTASSYWTSRPVRYDAPDPGASAVAEPFTRPAVNAADASSTPPFPSVDVGSEFEESSTDTQISAISALKTLLAGRLPSRRVLLRPGGARLGFRAPAPLGMLRVSLVSGSAGPLLAVGARWYDTTRTGVVRLRLTRAGRRALESGAVVTATLVARFVPDRGRSETESRRVVLGV